MSLLQGGGLLQDFWKVPKAQHNEAKPDAEKHTSQHTFYGIVAFWLRVGIRPRLYVGASFRITLLFLFFIWFQDFFPVMSSGAMGRVSIQSQTTCQSGSR